MSLATTEQRNDLIQGYRELADWLEAHPEAPIEPWQYGITMDTKYLPDEGLGKVIKTSPGHVAKWMKGGRKVHKDSYYGTYRLRVEFAGGLEYAVRFGEGDVCKPKAFVTVDKTEVRITDEARAEELREELAALEEVVVVGTEQRVTEWACPPSLLKAA